MNDDLISRQAAIDVLAAMQGRCTSKTALIQNSKIWQQIKDLPSAYPKRGKWLDYGDHYQCSVCYKTHIKKIQTIYGDLRYPKTAYCPYCGARMEE